MLWESPIFFTALRLWMIPLMGFGALSSHAGPLQPVTDTTPWRQAIVRLAIPVTRFEDGYHKTYVKDCTGTLIGDDPVMVLTAWHCFDGYADLSTLPNVLINERWWPARLRRTGGSMQADWALLTIVGPEPEPVLTLPLKRGALPAVGTALTMAGYSSDTATPANAMPLRYDDDCYLTALSAFWGVSNCRAEKGASGGPVLVQGSSQWEVIGVISASGPSGERLFAPIPTYVQPSLRP